MSYLAGQTQLPIPPSDSIIATPVNIPTNRTYTRYPTSVNGAYSSYMGSGVTGIDTISRITFGLKSGLESEIKWSLDTLVQLSFKQPDLLALKDNSFFKAELIKYLHKPFEFLNKDTENNMSLYILRNEAEFHKQLNYGLCSILALRNLSQDIKNSQILSLNDDLKNSLLEIINNPIVSSQIVTPYNSYQQLKELFNYAIDLIEQLSSFYSPATKNDPLFLSLMAFLPSSSDKAIIISILRSLARLMVKSKADEPSCADNISQKLWDQLIAYLMINDEELLLTTLDFLYQYSLPGKKRVHNLIKSESRLRVLVTQLPKLITYGLELPKVYDKPVRLMRRAKPPVPKDIPRLSPDLFNVIAEMEEPDRATTWMRCVYEPVFDGEVTQISLWKSYEKEFESLVARGKKLFPAVDFIKNVNRAFIHSSAMVVNLEDGVRKFIIKGIQPRQFLVDIDTANYDATKPLPNPNNVSNSINHDVIGPQQEPIPLMINFPERLSDFNVSVVNLINLLITDEGFRGEFKSTEQELWESIHRCPVLFEYVQEILASFD